MLRMPDQIVPFCVSSASPRAAGGPAGYPLVFHFVDKAQAYAEFNKIFARAGPSR